MASADVIVANRAYLDHSVPPGKIEPPGGGRGGLIEAVSPAVAAGERGTTWVGAGRGDFDRDYVDANGDELLETPGGLLRHRRIFFDAAEWDGFYRESSNAFLWPLLHLVREPLPRRAPYFPAPIVPTADAWRGYRQANRAYAEAAATAGRGEHCWIHDYQLGLVPAGLRECGYAGRIGYFLHTPFPSIELIAKVGGTGAQTLFEEWLAGILGADLVGLQSPADAARFVAAAASVGAEPGDGSLQWQGRSKSFGAFPVGIDTAALEAVAREAPPFNALEMLQAGAPVVVGLERADYTKGIPERLAAMAALWRSGVCFHYLGLASPTRAGVPGYEHFRRTVDGAVAMAVAAAEKAGCTCIQEERALAWAEVVALLRDAAVVCTSSLSDGMNLVPLQAAIAQSTRPRAERGVITAGKDTGVAAAYAGFANDGLVTIDPFDTPAFARAIRDALEGKPGRVGDRLVAAVREGDAHNWSRRYLGALEA